MNASNRKTLNNLLGTLSARRSELERMHELATADFALLHALLCALGNVHSELQEIRDAEQEKFDNMPENLQDSDRGQRMQECIDALDAAESSMQDGICALEEDAPESEEDALETFRDAIATALVELEDADSNISDAINA